jgi:predicted dehydrogenase
MVKHFDDVTIVARDIDTAKRFFALLGFEEEISTAIKGPTMEAYMGIPAIEAEHVTLVLKGAVPARREQFAGLVPQAKPRRPLEELLDCRLDLVEVLTPHPSHSAIALGPADARRVLELGLALQRSAGEGRPVRLDAGP